MPLSHEVKYQSIQQTLLGSLYIRAKYIYYPEFLQLFAILLIVL